MAGFWLYHAINFVLAALMYSLLARVLLSFVLAPDSANYIYRFFIRLTDPVVRGFAVVTPRAVPAPLLVLLCVVWLLMVRFSVFLAFAAAGLAPGLGA